MAVEQAIDEVEIARSTAPGANGEFAGHLRLGPCGKSGHFLMTYMHPLNGGFLECHDEAVEGVSDNAPYPHNSRGREGLS